MNMSLEIANIRSGYYGGIDILHDISIDVKSHKLTCILGPNGSGKSTILKTIYGFLKARSGTIRYNDEDITGFEPHELLMKGIAYVPQERSIFPQLSVFENLKVGAWLIRKNKRLVSESIDKVFKIFPRLEERKAVKAGNLSGGEQKMLEFGRAMILNPQTILVDEPTAGLAPKIAHEVYQILDQLKKEKITILMVDQNVRQGVLFSDYIYVIDLGRIKDEGASEKFKVEMKKLIKSWI